MNSMRNMSSDVYADISKIQQYYEGKTILLTGGTGFLGKILVEKLLRSCPKIRGIYLLVREKRGLTAEERLRQLLDVEIFDKLKQTRPSFVDQLYVVAGDLSKPVLGLTPERVALITQSVQIVIHTAATIKFDERLCIAISTNVAATKELCLLAQNMVKLEAFVYVSTAYAHCDTPLVHEKVTPSPISPENLMKLPQLLDDQGLDEATPILLDSKPNTYIYTKCAAEDVINSFKESLPVAIFRPSIVLAALSEPMAGWLDNVLGPTGMVTSLSTGLLHVLHINQSAKTNCVPVDYTANAIIALAFSIAQHKWESGDVPVVNFVSTADNSITWGRYTELCQSLMWKYPSQKLVWYPFGIATRYKWLYVILRAMFHHAPANVIDWLSAKLGRPTRLRRLHTKLDKYVGAVTYFCTREFNFEEGNAQRLWNTLDEEDKRIFPFNMSTFNWERYFDVYLLGCRKFLLKEDCATLTRSRMKYKMLYILHFTTSLAVFLLFFRVISYVRKFVNFQLTHINK